MLSTVEIRNIEQQILEKLPRLLEQDEHFRLVIEGILTEKFPRRDEFRELVEEIKALRIESTQRFEAMDRRFEATQAQIEASRQESEKRSKDLSTDLQDLRHSVDVQVGGLQPERWEAHQALPEPQPSGN